MSFVVPQTALARLLGQTAARDWVEPVNLGLARSKVPDALQASHWLGQWLHETQGFTKFAENLYYTDADRLCRVFTKKFKIPAQARPYLRNPERLGNYVYAGLNGNGPEESGDGYRFRGHWAPHITFRNNTVAFAAWVGRPEIVANPDAFLDDRELVALSGAYWWETHGMAGPASRNDYPGVRATLNPKLVGLKEATDWTNRVHQSLLRR